MHSNSFKTHKFAKISRINIETLLFKEKIVRKLNDLVSSLITETLV